MGLGLGFIGLRLKPPTARIFCSADDTSGMTGAKDRGYEFVQVVGRADASQVRTPQSWQPIRASTTAKWFWAGQLAPVCIKEGHLASSRARFARRRDEDASKNLEDEMNPKIGGHIPYSTIFPSKVYEP